LCPKQKLKGQEVRPKDLFVIYYFANFALLKQNMHMGAKEKELLTVPMRNFYQK